jgi:O-antigen ligase
MSIRNASVVVAATVVAVTAILGGAFFPGPRLVVGVLLAVVMGWGTALIGRRLAADEWLLFAFITWAVLSAVAAASAPLAARETLAVWMVAWVLWLVARRACGVASQAGLMILCVSAVIVALGVALEAFGFGQVRVGGLLENPNVAASLLVVAVPSLMPIAWWRGLRLAAATVIVLGLVLTGSRAGLLALLAAAAIALPRGRARLLGLATGGAGVAAVLIWRFADQPDVLAWFRPAIWSAVLRLWWANPVAGVGPGGLVDAAGAQRILHADHVGQHQFLIAYAESSPLAVLVQTGLVGFLIAAAALVVWWRRVRRERKLSRPLRAALAAMAVMAGFHDLLTVDVVLWWWALVIGLAETREPQPVSDRKGLRLSTSPRPVIGLVSAFIVLWGVVQPASARWTWRSAGPNQAAVAPAIRSEGWLDTPLEWRTRDLLRQESWDWETAAEAVSHAHRAVRIHPGAARLWSILGLVHARVVAEHGPWPDSVERARAAFARATELEPHLPWAWLEWARLERNLGRTSVAIDLVRRALEEEPHTVQARLFLARLELDRGNEETARDVYFEAVQSARLSGRTDLNTYERELLSAPAWQFRELGEVLR